METLLVTSRILTGAAALAISAACTGIASGQQQPIQIVGSSTVFPFSTAVAERFAQTSDFPAPVVESTGTGGGIKLFCDGVGESTADIANASRRMRDTELQECQANGVTPVEVKIGYDGIVLATAKGDAKLTNLTGEQIFRALAKQLPNESGQLQPNPNQNWSDVNASLPDAKIEVLGPPPTSGTRDAFVELMMDANCPELVEAAGVCGEIREDGIYVEAGENDNLIVQKLEANPNAIGIFGFSFLDQNSDQLQGASIGGVEPTFENIASGEYPVSRSLYFYVKKEHVGQIPGIQEFVEEFTSEETWGPDGYLAEAGLIPLRDDERSRSAEAAQSMQALLL
jgi:phosphate transport system substrate-binding protein